MKKAFVFSLLLVFVSTVTLVAAPPMYDIIDLGTLGGQFTTPTAINNDGVVTGYSSTTDGGSHAFLYDGISMQDLGSLGHNSWGYGINDTGQVVGTSQILPNSDYFPFYYDGSTLHNLGTLGGTHSYANDINNNGLIIGESQPTGSSYFHAFLYDGMMHDLGTLGGNHSWALAINDNDLMVGSSYTADGYEHAFLYDGTMHDLGTLEGRNYSKAYDINKYGHIVGGSETAFLYDGSIMHDLGDLAGNGSWAEAINDNGQIVGMSYDSNYFIQPFIYQNGSMYDLNNLIPEGTDWLLMGAVDINNSGQIIGYGRLNGEDRAFLMNPVPEPASAILVIVGAGLLRFGKRKR